MAVAAWQQVAAALGRPASDFGSDQQGQLTWWLDGVELLIRNRLGPVSGLDQDNLVYVEVEAVAEKVRRLTHTESSITVTAEDGSVTRRYENTPVTDGDVTTAWWELLDPAGTSDAFTINPFAGRCR